MACSVQLVIVHIALFYNSRFCYSSSSLSRLLDDFTALRLRFLQNIWVNYRFILATFATVHRLFKLLRKKPVKRSREGILQQSEDYQDCRDLCQREPFISSQMVIRSSIFRLESPRRESDVSGCICVPDALSFRTEFGPTTAQLAVQKLQ